MVGKKKEGNGEHDKYTFQNRIWRISVGRKKINNWEGVGTYLSMNVVMTEDSMWW